VMLPHSRSMPVRGSHRTHAHPIQPWVRGGFGGLRHTTTRMKKR
jgi:hypothetical protein